MRKAIAATERPPSASELSAALVPGWRRMLEVEHVPEQLLDVTIHAGDVRADVHVPVRRCDRRLHRGLPRRHPPGVLVMSVLFTTVSSGVALNTDRTKGVIDRFRSLPVGRAAPLLGSLLGDAVRFVVAGMDGGFMSIFPLTSLSDVFVAPATLPSVLRAFVEVDPVSLLATASRGLMDGTAQGGDVAGVLLVAAGLTAVFAPLTTLLDRRG